MTYKKIANIIFIAGMLTCNAATIMFTAEYCSLPAIVAVAGVNMIVWAVILNSA